MATTHIKPTIELITTDHKLSSIKLIMPVWKKEGGINDNISIPLLGLTTFAKKDDQSDMDTAIKEALETFVLIAEKYGLGLSSELEMAGWKRTEASSVKEVFELDFGMPVIDDLMDTGLETAVSIDVPNNKNDEMLCFI